MCCDRLGEQSVELGPVEFLTTYPGTDLDVERSVGRTGGSGVLALMSVSSTGSVARALARALRSSRDESAWRLETVVRRGGADHGIDVDGHLLEPWIEVEADIRRIIEEAAASQPGIRVDIKRLLLANAMRPLPGAQPLVHAIQKHGEAVFGEPIPAMGTPLYTDVRLYAEAGIPGVIYGAGPRTVLESHAKRSDERIVLEDLRRATKVIARALSDLLRAEGD